MDAAVLDFDGVLVDSMPSHAEGYRRVLEPLGIHIDHRDIFLLEGARSEAIIADLLQRHGQVAPEGRVDALAEEKQEIFRGMPHPTVYDEAPVMLRRIRACAAKVALVTGTRRANIEALIPDLMPSFDAVLSQESYTKSKPDPEPFARAADAIGRRAADCVALENSIRGVQSARAAGYGHIVAITTTLREQELADAGAQTIVFDHGTAADVVCDLLST